MKKTPVKMNDLSSGQGKEKNYKKQRIKKKKKKYDDNKVSFSLSFIKNLVSIANSVVSTFLL